MSSYNKKSFVIVSLLGNVILQYSQLLLLLKTAKSYHRYISSIVDVLAICATCQSSNNFVVTKCIYLMYVCVRRVYCYQENSWRIILCRNILTLIPWRRWRPLYSYKTNVHSWWHTKAFINGTCLIFTMNN